MAGSPPRYGQPTRPGRPRTTSRCLHVINRVKLPLLPLLQWRPPGSGGQAGKPTHSSPLPQRLYGTNIALLPPKRNINYYLSHSLCHRHSVWRSVAYSTCGPAAAGSTGQARQAGAVTAAAVRSFKQHIASVLCPERKTVIKETKSKRNDTTCLRFSHCPMTATQPLLKQSHEAGSVDSLHNL